MFSLSVWKFVFSRSVWKRVVFEYWPAFILAVLWAFFRAWPFQSDWLGTFIANFGTAFFIISWYTGQLFRIERQTSGEQKLDTLGKQLEVLTGTVGTLNERVNASPQLSGQLAGLTGTANVQLAEANSAFADVRRTIGSLPWATQWSVPSRAPNMGVQLPAQSDVPQPPKGPTGPPR